MCPLFRSLLLFLLLLFSNLTLAVQQNHRSPKPFQTHENDELFSIKGSNTIGARLAPLWAKRYLENKGLELVEIVPGENGNEYVVMGINQGEAPHINVFAHGSSTGFIGLNDQSADIAAASRSIKPAENQKLSASVDFTHFAAEHVVAIDGLAVIVHPQNPINELSKQQVKKIFSGKITSWQELGGRDEPINVYARDDKSGTWDTFKSVVLGKKNPLVAGAKRYESNDDLSGKVSGDINAIGFVGLASVLKAKALAISDSGTRAILPDPLFVATEDYPISRRLFMYIDPSKSNQYVQEFLDFVHSSEGQEVVAEVGFVSQRPISVPSTIKDGPDDYLKLVKNGRRLSVNFRFKAGSATLDNKAKRDIQRVANFMQEESNQNKLLQLVGFGGAQDREDRSIVLSKLRAMAVKTELRKYDVYTESVVGFGSELPVASQRSSNKAKNNRVEVWLFDEDAKPSLTQVKRSPSSKSVAIQASVF